jgi:hypothetical protein
MINRLPPEASIVQKRRKTNLFWDKIQNGIFFIKALSSSYFEPKMMMISYVPDTRY